jgi:hypothetical protein
VKCVCVVDKRVPEDNNGLCKERVIKNKKLNVLKNVGLREIEYKK